MVASHYYCYCSWIGQPPENYSIQQDIDIYNMNMPKFHEDDANYWHANEDGEKIIDKTKINIYLDSNEPDWYAPYPLPTILEKAPLFDVLLTRRPELLHLPNAKLFLYGTHWCGENYEPTQENKKDAVSFSTTHKVGLYSDKEYTDHAIQPPDGYKIRHDIGNNFESLQKISKLPLHGFKSERYPVDYNGFNHTLSKADDGKLDMLRYKFHVAVENSSLPNYMTEKLHDCFMTKTVPIYYGCPNVSEHYNMDGILKFNSLEELGEILSSLTPEKYESMKDALEDNYQRFLQVEGDGFHPRFWRAIEEVTKK